MNLEASVSGQLASEEDSTALSTSAGRANVADVTTQEAEGHPTLGVEMPAPQLLDTPVPKRRGRPPKQPAPTTTLANTSKKRTREAVEEAESAVAPQPKRSRIQYAEEGVEAEVPPVVPRRRGRPRKKSTKQPENGPVVAETAGAALAKSGEQNAATGRPRRGRPRKS
jgi:hypothetical protein